MNLDRTWLCLNITPYWTIRPNKRGDRPNPTHQKLPTHNRDSKHSHLV
ncbi:hypothetical protein [Baaleninema sp.]